MKTLKAARAHPNIAFIKYWGVRDQALHLPVNGSISMNLASLFTEVEVQFDSSLSNDELVINSLLATDSQHSRMHSFLNQVRNLSGSTLYAHVSTTGNFPIGAGIASSASVFAAAALAASSTLGLHLDQSALSRLARLGSGSACRSIPAGFVEWHVGSSDASSFAESIAAPDHWDLVDCIVIINKDNKKVSSKEGHSLASTSPLQTSRVADAPHRLDVCRNAILNRDFSALAEIVELDSNWMHAVMMTSKPALLYWEPATIQLMKYVIELRHQGNPVCFTVDAGPNLHIITTSENEQKIIPLLTQIPGVIDIMSSPVGGQAELVIEV